MMQKYAPQIVDAIHRTAFTESRSRSLRIYYADRFSFSVLFMYLIFCLVLCIRSSWLCFVCLVYSQRRLHEGEGRDLAIDESLKTSMMGNKSRFSSGLFGDQIVHCKLTLQQCSKDHPQPNQNDFDPQLLENASTRVQPRQSEYEVDNDATFKHRPTTVPVTRTRCSQYSKVQTYLFTYRNKLQNIFYKKSFCA